VKHTLHDTTVHCKTCYTGGPTGAGGSGTSVEASGPGGGSVGGSGDGVGSGGSGGFGAGDSNDDAADGGSRGRMQPLTMAFALFVLGTQRIVSCSLLHIGSSVLCMFPLYLACL